MDNQSRWNRYCKAINFCISYGYFIEPIDSNNGNVKAIKVGFWDEPGTITTIPLKPKKYKCLELLEIIHNTIGGVKYD